jgi:hypothetical protein
VKLCQAGLLLVIAAAPCLLAQKIDIDTDKAFPFETFRRYQWREHPWAQKDPVMRQATVAAEIIRSRGNEILIQRGYQPVDDKPDFYITYFVTGQVYDTMEIISAVGSTYWYGWGSPVFVDGWAKYKVDKNADGLLIIDIVDAKTSDLKWRAYCRDTVKEWKKRTELIDKIVTKALKKFPPEK